MIAWRWRAVSRGSARTAATTRAALDRPAAGRVATAAPAILAVGGQVSLAAAVLLYLNRTLAGDVYFLLASGRHLAEHGLVARSPFPTLAEGAPWDNQQWLVELTFYAVHQAGGLALLSVAYAAMLGAGLAPLVWMCRDRPPALVAVAWAIAVACLVAVLDPRAAGFSVVLFAVVAAVLERSRHRRSALLVLPPLFLLWANLHGALPIGLLLVALAGLGAAVLPGPGRAPALAPRRAIPYAATLAASILATLVTPLGLRMADYLRAYDDHVSPIRLPFEWQATYLHPPVLVPVVAFSVLAVWLWHHAERPRPLEPLLVAAAFAAFALTATRQVVWLGPLALYMVAVLGAPQAVRPRLRLAGAPAMWGVALLAAWWGLVGPAPPGPPQAPAALRAALADPPVEGRLLTPPGAGSYALWLDPRRPIAIDGRLELYGTREVVASYRIMDGVGAMADLERWGVGGVVTRNPRGAQMLQRRGFRIVARTSDGYYLVRRRGPANAS